jgi:hypothetical protein
VAHCAPRNAPEGVAHEVLLLCDMQWHSHKRQKKGDYNAKDNRNRSCRIIDGVERADGGSRRASSPRTKDSPGADQSAVPQRQ